MYMLSHLSPLCQKDSTGGHTCVEIVKYKLAASLLHYHLPRTSQLHLVPPDHSFHSWDCSHSCHGCPPSVRRLQFSIPTLLQVLSLSSGPCCHRTPGEATFQRFTHLTGLLRTFSSSHFGRQPWNYLSTGTED